MDNPTLHDERVARIKRVIDLAPVDRIPIVQNASAFAPRFIGMSMAHYCEDPEAPMNAQIEAMDRIGGFDGINAAMVGRPTVFLPTVWLSRIAVPGRELPADSLYQVREAEVMTPADYDVIIDKGWQPFIENYLPKVADTAEIAEATSWLMANLRRGIGLYRQHGYVVMAANPVTTPFEYFCGGRSMAKFVTDLFRMPDKVQAAMDSMLPDAIAQGIAGARAAGTMGVWVAGWRTASSLLSPKLWNRFVWPYFVRIVEAVLAEGLIPILHLDQDWTRDLARFQDLPAKKCIMNPDGMTDMRKFKELLGDRMAMMGDVPAALFAAGTPDDVRSYVRELVELFGSRGLILCPGCDAPINTKPENMKAFVQASREFGTDLA